jgi:phosphosulfolactate synthase (CoM biosynthesis protein A)
MGLEKDVLAKVAKIVKTDKLAGFEFGTLFVVCNEKEARSIYHKLTKDYGLGKIQISKAGPNDYSYDFVA